MSLISDPDYLVHSLRLGYLRHVDDSYGRRIISFSSRYTSNPHVLASGLADRERWPELNAPSSPPPSDEESGTTRTGRRRHNGPHKLNYTQTIMGPSRVGMAGMRVNGKRVSKEPPLPPLPAEAAPKRTRAGSEPTPVPNTNDINGDKAPGSPGATPEPWIQVGKRRSAGGSSLSELAASIFEKATGGSLLQEKAPITAAPPSMTRIAELQARRRHRRARFSSTGHEDSKPMILPETNGKGDVSSDDGGDVQSETSPNSPINGESVDEGSDDGDSSPDTEEEEDFDPEFAPPQISIVSDGPSVASVTNSVLSTSSVFDRVKTRSYHSRTNTNTSSNLLSTGEGDMSDTGAHPATSGSGVDSYFEIVHPPRPNTDKRATKNIPSKEGGGDDSITFTRRKVGPPVRSSSALTQQLQATSNNSTNPFTELYALISGRGEVASMNVTVFFPHARSSDGEVEKLELSVRKDATVEEVLGFALWSYWEEGLLPKLDEGLGGDDDLKRKVRLSASGWVLRIAEDDGEVDEDFPALDRMAKISKFNFDFAILEATPGQVSQNQQLELKIVRRPSRIIVAKKPEASAMLTAPAPSTNNIAASAQLGSTLVSSMALPSSLGNISVTHGPQVLLRIRVADADDKAIHYKTTISVSATMYMQDVLDLICRKRKMASVKDWALLSSDYKVLVMLDRTVASLEGNSELVLVMRSTLPSYGYPVDGDRKIGKTTDPNASIFKRASEIQPKMKGTEMDFFSAYKKYTVYRKVPVVVGRLERTLAIDGDYIHIMPSSNRARGVFDSGKTVSFHIKSVASCTQSAKHSASFKLIVKRDGGEKRYDFEAENAKLAGEIVACVKAKKGGLDRSSTVGRSRRSRQVVVN